MLTSFIRRAAQLFHCNIYGIEDTFIYIYTRCPATLGLPFHFSFPSHQKSESFPSRQSLRELLFTAGKGKGKLGKEKKEKMEKPKGQRLFRQKELLPPACGSTHSFCSLLWAFVFMAVNSVTPCLFSPGSLVGFNTACSIYLSAQASVTAMKPCCTRPN